MAFNDQPDTWITGWQESAGSILIPISSFPELTAAEADAATGDIRKIWFAILEKLWNEWNDRAAGDRPGKWTQTKSMSVNTTTGVVTTTYVSTIYTGVLTQEVVDE